MALQTHDTRLGVVGGEKARLRVKIAINICPHGIVADGTELGLFVVLKPPHRSS